MNENNESQEQDYVTASERHAQIMDEMTRFFRFLALCVLGTLTVICGFVIFLFINSPFWKYP